MPTLDEQLEAARAEVNRIERAIAGAPCAEVGHRWVSMGGCNAGCDVGAELCNCSVPVNVCAACKDCDYGDNDEAQKIREVCRDRNLDNDYEVAMLDHPGAGGKSYR